VEVTRVVVTGGAGFIGSHLTEALLARGALVHVVDDLSNGRRANLPTDHERLRFEQVDIGDGGAGSAALNAAVAEADLVFHLASPIGVRRVHEHRLEICQSILASATAVVQACRTWRKPLLVSSSSEVYGTGLARPLAESDALPLGLEARWGYAAGKFMLEHLLLGLIEETGVAGWIVRFFNIAGPRQRPEVGLCIAVFTKAALDGRPIVVHGDGRQQRAFLHVKDAVAGLLAVVGTSELVGRPVNLGGPAAVSIRDVADTVRARVNNGIEIQHKSSQEVFGPGFSDATIRIPDLSLVRRTTTWAPQRTLADIIDDCAASLRAER